MYEFGVQTRQHCAFVNLDREIQRIVSEADMSEGVVKIFVPHTTAAVTINENADPDVLSDMEMVLERMAPWQGGYAHAEGNTAAHVKASMMGFSETVFVRDGKLALGTWQSIYFCEFDGPRSRRVWVQLMPL